MKLRYKILNGLAAVLVLGISGLLITVSVDSACPDASVPAGGAEAMRAVMHRCYGVPHGIRIEQIAKPVPKDDQVLIKVFASSVNPAEWYGISGRPKLIRLSSGIGTPKGTRAGYDVAGTVEAVGKDVTLFKPGDPVFGGVGAAYSEYVVTRETGSIVMKPENLSFEEAAAIPIAAVTALQGLRDQGRIKAGQKVLINGASGGVGTYAVQIAKAYGAEVTGVCSTRNVEMVRSLGADHVVDYKTDDFTQSAARYDIIFDNIGNHGFTDLASITNPDGVIVMVGGSKEGAILGPIKRVAWGMVMRHFIEPRSTFFVANINKADLEWLAALAREGKLRSVIDRRYPLEETGAALEYLGRGHAQGKVVVTVD
jgi:NADPH:quinone reductase-like Zn-dependent oxidoreductase